MPVLSFLLPLVLAGGAAPAPSLAAGQRWKVESRAVDGRLEAWTLRLTAPVSIPRARYVLWEGVLEGASLPGTSQVRLEREADERGRTVLSASVQSFDGRSQPDLRVCAVVLGDGQSAQKGAWNGVYGFGLSGQRQLNASLAGGPRGDLLGTCQLTRLGP